MASTAGREVMNSEVAGSILTVFPQKKKKKGFSHVQEPVKLNNLKTTMRAMHRIRIVASHSNTEKLALARTLGTSSGILT